MNSLTFVSASQHALERCVPLLFSEWINIYDTSVFKQYTWWLKQIKQGTAVMFRQRKTIKLSYSWHVVSVKLQVLWLKKIATKPCNVFIDETLWAATLFLLPSGMYEGGTRMDNSTACILNHQIHSQPCYFFSAFSITALPPAIAFCSCLIETLRGKRAADSI